MLFATTAVFAQPTLRQSRHAAQQPRAIQQQVKQKDVRAEQRHELMAGQKAVMNKAPRRAGIEAQPEGTVYDLFGSYSAMYYSWWYGWIDGSTDTGMMTLVEGTDGNIYIQGLTPYTGLDTYYWVKAERGEGDTITIAKQPCGYYTSYYGDVHEYEIARIAYSYDEESESEDIHMADDPTIKMLYKGNGVLQTIDEMNNDEGDIPSFIYGPVEWYDADEENEIAAGWYTNNEYYWSLSTAVNDEEYAEPSADATIEQMLLSYKNADADKAKMIDVAFEGNTVYLKLYTRTPGWVKGTIEGDKVVVANQQYLGYDSYYASYEWAHTATTEMLYDEDYSEYYDQGTITAQTVFDYNAETREMSTTGSIYIDGKSDEIYYAEYYKAPTIKYFVETAAVPADPTIAYWYDYDEAYESAELDFIINTVGTNGEYLVPEKLSYKVYVDGEPFVFATDEYYVEEDMEEIPVDFTDGYGIGSGYLLLFFQPAEKVGLQSIYRGADVEKCSNIVWYDIATGETSVEDTTVGVKGIVENDKRQTAVYDLQGRRAGSNAKGLLLMSNGQKMVKVVRK